MIDLTVLSGLDGLITDEIGEALYWLARDVPADQGVVELGSYKGASTCYLAAGARDGHGPPVFAVDAWDPTRPGRHNVAVGEFEAQLAAQRLDGFVTPIRALTTTAADLYAGPPVGLLFVDADHTHLGVTADMGAWRIRLTSGATVVFDDYATRQNPGVTSAVTEMQRAGVLHDLQQVAGRLAVCRAP